MDLSQKKDFINVTLIGALVGLLAQPILANAVADVTPIIRIGVFLGFLVLAPFALFITSLLGKFVSAVLYQFGKFAAVGVLNTFVDLGVFNLCTFFYGAVPSGTFFSLFKGLSFVGATTNSFFWNKYWTFHSGEAPQPGQVTKFYVVAVGGLVINVIVATLVFKSGGVDPSPFWTNILSPMVGVASAFLWDFLGYKFLVFKKG